MHSKWQNITQARIERLVVNVPRQRRRAIPEARSGHVCYRRIFEGLVQSYGDLCVTFVLCLMHSTHALTHVKNATMKGTFWPINKYENDLQNSDNTFYAKYLGQ